jgi:hypothetical protein
MWGTTTVRRILRNEAYIGALVQGKKRKVSYKSQKVIFVPKCEWITVKNNHEPIIDERTFFAAQRLIDCKRTGYSIGEDDSPERCKPHLLAGKLVCLDCGAAMQRSGKSRNGKHSYIRCKVSAGTKRRDCTPHYVSENRIQDMVKERIRVFISGIMTDEVESEIVNEVYNRLNKTRGLPDKKQKQLAEIETKIKTIQKNIMIAYTDKLSNVISESDFLNFREEFEKEEQSLINRKVSLEKELADCEGRLNTNKDISALLEKRKSIDVLTHEVVNDFVRIIQIGEKDPATNEQEIVINWLF